MSVMSNQSISMNSGEGLLPGRCPTEQQGGHGHLRTNAKGGRRRKWSQEVNWIVMECYYSSNPEVEIYRENVYDLESKRNVWCKRTTVVESEEVYCYKKVVPWFRVELD